MRNLMSSEIDKNSSLGMSDDDPLDANSINKESRDGLSASNDGEDLNQQPSVNVSNFEPHLQNKLSQN